MELDEVKNLLKSSSLTDNLTVKEIQSLKGDASSRRYSRLITDSGSFIMMEMDDSPGPVFDGAVKLLQRETFPEVQRFLENGGISVPKIVAEFKDLKILIVEDIGDVSLGRLVRDGQAKDVGRIQKILGPDYLREAYLRAIDVMAKIQSLPRTNHFVFQKSLGLESLKTEMLRFIDMYAKPKGATEKALAEMITEINELAGRLVAHPQVLIYRDFMPMNIHFKEDGSVVLIDFQDLCMGPQGYDLGSLLTDRDFDFEIGPVLIDQLVDYAKNKFHQAKIEEFYTEAVLQRTLRLIGQFTRLAETKSKEYGKFVPGAIRRAQQLLNNYDRCPAIKKFLG